MKHPVSPSAVLRLVSSTPRPARQPTASADRQHLARLAQADPWTVRHSTDRDLAHLRALNAADRSLIRPFDEIA